MITKGHDPKQALKSTGRRETLKPQALNPQPESLDPELLNPDHPKA